MMHTAKTHWASLITLIVLGTSLLFSLMTAVVIGLASFIDLIRATGDPAAEMISAAAFGFVSLVICLCIWFILQKTRGLEATDLPFEFPFPNWLKAALPILVVFSILIGGLGTLAESSLLNWFLLPALTVTVIASTLWLLFGIASNRIGLGPRWRFFAIFGLSMTVAPVVMIFIEIAVLLAIIVAGSVYLTIAHPETISELERLTSALQYVSSEEDLIAMLAPYLSNPALIAAGFGYLALLIPLIEEIFKPLAVWLFARRIESPGQGFALGALCGAAFALFESLNASADSSTSWALIVTARIGTSALHMATTGLVGWGIAAAFKERRILRLMAAYVSAVLIHGVWNASAAGVGLTALGESIGKPEWLYNAAPALLCGLSTMGAGVAAIIIRANRALRSDIKDEVKVESPA